MGKWTYQFNCVVGETKLYSAFDGDGNVLIPDVPYDMVVNLIKKHNATLEPGLSILDQEWEFDPEYELPGYGTVWADADHEIPVSFDKWKPQIGALPDMARLLVRLRDDCVKNGSTYKLIEAVLYKSKIDLLVSLW